MSVKNFISDNLPPEWDYCARKLKMRTELIERLYQTIPTCFRNKYKYKFGINVIKNIFDYWYINHTNIIHLIEATDLDIKKWNKLNSEIIKYMEECK